MTDLNKELLKNLEELKQITATREAEANKISETHNKWYKGFMSRMLNIKF